MRALVYDRTCGRLSRIWATGARLYRRLGRIDAMHAAESWTDALGWLATLPDPIDEVQYWGHGKWGAARVDRDVLDASALRGGPLHAGLERLRDQLARDALVWFRTCETFGAAAGIDFAERFADFLGARVAGHTFIIGYHQSGLHGIAPGVPADWSADEGLREGSASDPRRARWSTPWATRTVTAFTGAVPDRWFAR